MSLNGIFLHYQINADIKKKVQRGTNIMFPTIHTSSIKNQPQNKKTRPKQITSDKDLYLAHSKKKNVSHLTNLDFYSMNPKDIVTNNIKFFQIPNSKISNKKQEINLTKQTCLKRQKNKDLQTDFKMLETQRPINKLRATFIARKSGNLNENGEKSFNKLNTTKKSIGNYIVTKQIGHGGFAKVYQVMHKETNAKYAMKQYNLPEAFQCYQKEANIGQLFFKDGNIRDQFFEFQGTKFIIKYVQKIKNNKKGYIIQEIGGINLSKLLSQIKGVFHNKQRVYEVKFLPFYDKMKDKQFFASIVTQICSGVECLNRRGFVHCDLKLENILVDWKDNDTNSFPMVKVIDFGSTFEAARGIPKITITPQYMPPELLRQYEKNGCQGGQIVYQKIDVWSIGCILFQIFTGVPLWFRYKCKVCSKERNKVELGIFALTNRDYAKIVKKQQQLCDSLIRSSGFVCHEWQRYRGLLKQIFVMNPQKRISVGGIIQRLKEIK